MTEPTREQLIERHRVSAAGYFERDLQHFVRAYAPTDPIRRDQFQRDLTMLFRSAMQSQAETLSRGIEHFASDQYRALAMRPLQAIFTTEPEGK